MYHAECLVQSKFPNAILLIKACHNIKEIRSAFCLSEFSRQDTHLVADTLIIGVFCFRHRVIMGQDIKAVHTKEALNLRKIIVE